jgi:uncharacterized protein YeaO (DUF488 family)
MSIVIKRVYEPFSKADGYRILVDRLWPQGIKKEDAHVDLWLKEVAPSTALRKWFNHEPEKWKPFVTKYKAELKASTAWPELMALLKQHKTVTLLYGARDEQYNQAVALKQFIG